MMPMASQPNMIRRLGPVSVLAAMAGTLPVIGGFLLIGFMPVVSDWLLSHREFGFVLYVGGFIVAAGLALLPTYAQSLLAGYAFGLWWGSLGAMLGFAGAAWLAYHLVVYFAGRRVTDMIAEQPKWRAVDTALVRSGWGRTLLIVTLLRVPPNSPFSLTNLVLASARVAFGPYILGTVLGLIPRTFAAVFIGAQVSDWSSAERRMPMWLLIAGIAATIIALVVIGRIARRAVSRITAPALAAESAPIIEGAVDAISDRRHQ